MARDQTELTTRLSTLREFAMVATRRHPAVDATLLQLIRDHGAGPIQEARTAIFRDLYRRLRVLDKAALDAAAPRRRAIGPWAEFDRLCPRQRAALFLVLTAGFSIRQVARILDLSSAELASEMGQAIFYLEHVYPFSTPPAEMEIRKRGEVYA